MPTPLRFDPVEVFSVSSLAHLPRSFQLNTTPIYHRALLIRLLTGNLNFRCTVTNQVTKQRNDYSTLSFTSNNRANKSRIESSVSCKINDIDSYVLSTANINRVFYRELFHEYCSFFHQNQNRNHVVAFLHLYRILERIAYCLPLMWAARANDYEKTFTQLKSYFSEPKIGELGVLKKFIQDSIDITFRQVSITISVNSIHSDWQKNHYNSIKSSIPTGGVVAESQYSSITTNYEFITELTIKIRNGYFHALTGAANSFSSEQIVDSNEFFRAINEPIVNWLSFLLFQIIEHEIK